MQQVLVVPTKMVSPTKLVPPLNIWIVIPLNRFPTADGFQIVQCRKSPREIESVLIENASDSQITTWRCTDAKSLKTTKSENIKSAGRIDCKWWDTLHTIRWNRCRELHRLRVFFLGHLLLCVTRGHHESAVLAGDWTDNTVHLDLDSVEAVRLAHLGHHWMIYRISSRHEAGHRNVWPTNLIYSYAFCSNMMWISKFRDVGTVGEASWMGN